MLVDEVPGGLFSERLASAVLCILRQDCDCGSEQTRATFTSPLASAPFSSTSLGWLRFHDVSSKVPLSGGFMMAATLEVMTTRCTEELCHTSLSLRYL